jgi:hypothetical protein
MLKITIIITIIIIIIITTIIILTFFDNPVKWINLFIYYSYIPNSLKNTIIPMNVYQTWHSKNLSPKMKECNDTLKIQNPEFNYFLFDDLECRTFIATNFNPNVLHAYDSLIPGAYKADLWRYCILYMKGGLYIDIKYKCMNQFRLIQFIENKENKNMCPLITETNPKYVYTGVLITPPKNPLYKKCIDQIVINVNKKYYGNTPMSPTGPDMFGEFIPPDEIKKAHLFYYDDYFEKTDEKWKYGKQGHIKNLHTNEIIMSHYLEYRKELKKYAKTKYWMNLWKNKNIYCSSNQCNL